MSRRTQRTGPAAAAPISQIQLPALRGKRRSRAKAAASQAKPATRKVATKAAGLTAGITRTASTPGGYTSWMSR